MTEKELVAVIIKNKGVYVEDDKIKHFLQVEPLDCPCYTLLPVNDMIYESVSVGELLGFKKEDKVNDKKTEA